MEESSTAFSSTSDVSTNVRLPVMSNLNLFAQTEELLAKFDTEASQSLTASSKEQNAGVKRLRQAKVTSKCREYRLAQKCKRDELRRQEKELSTELVVIQRAKEKEKIRLEALRTPAYFVWKSFAIQKLTERLYAEAEQRHLAAAVQAQAVYIDQMKKVLLKRNSIDFRHQETQRQSTECALFNLLIQEVNENFLRIDQVFKDCGLDLLETETEVKSEQRSKSDGKVEFYEYLMKIVQPFSLSEMSNSLWKSFHGYYIVKTDYERCCGVQDPENTYAISFRERISLTTGERIFVRQRAVLRRFSDDDRVVFTWKFLSEGQGIFYGIHEDNIGWATVQPSTNPSEPGTVLTVCNRRQPLRFASNSTSEQEEQLKNEFHRFLEDIDDEAWGTIVLDLEKLLIDDALADIHPSPAFVLST